MDDVGIYWHSPEARKLSKTSTGREKKKEKFLGSMRKPMSREVLSQEWIVKFSKRAQEYIMSYNMIWQQQNLQQQPSQDDATVTTPMIIEKLVKEFKNHQCALDFEYKDILENSPD